MKNTMNDEARHHFFAVALLVIASVIAMATVMLYAPQDAHNTVSADVVPIEKQEQFT